MGAHRRLLLGLLLVASSVYLLHAQDYNNEEEARQYLDRLEANLSIECNRVTNASWNYNTDLTDEHLKEQSEATVEFGTFYKNSYDELSKWKWKSFKDPELQRRFSYLSMLGTSILNDTDLEHFNNLLGDMQNTYSTAKLCPYNQTGGVCNMELEPEVTQIMAESRDFDELSYFWESWRDKTGKKVKDQFWDYVQLNNEAARQNNFSDAGEMWLDKYKADNISTDDFRTIVADLWKQVEPLYKQLYSYVRNRLRETYKPNIREFGYIPANVLGNMWAQDWSNIASLVKPFPEVADFDVTPAMQEQGWNATRMFQTAEEFFTSLGLPEMTDTFWMKSMIVKPADREVICHASAEDFCLPNGTDFRIKMCTVVNMEYLITIHHEMGHIEYFMAYTPLDYVFRDSANPGFHEAIGDTMALSVRTPKHLQKIGLLPDNTTTTSTTSPTTKTTTSTPSTTTPATSTTTQTTSTTTSTTPTTTSTTSITSPTTSTTAPTTSTKPPTTSTTPPTTSTKPPTTLTTTPTTSTKPPITSTTAPTTPTTAPTASNAATPTASSKLFHAEAKEERANQHESPQKMKCTDIGCKQGINFLMQTALEKVAFLPFGYILDLWRWEVFAGDVTKDTMNDRWWELRKQYQGLVPPVPRGLDDFDPGAKYHVVADVPYIRYFVSFIVQFQFHKALCIKANEYDPRDLHKPLHNCDIYQSKDAGRALENFLKLGFSEPWPTALKTLTGSESLNADAILEYFKPLSDFLQEENNRLGGCIGWGDDCLPQARQFVSSYNVDGAQKCTALQRAKWDYETFITQGNSDGLNRKIIDYSEFVMTEQHQLTDKFDPGQFADSNDKQLIKEIDEIGYLGISALSADDHNKYNDDVRMMESTYSTAKLCPYDDQGCSDPTLHLNPDLNRMMKEERDMEKLKYLWSEWRDTVGKPIRDVYGEYMDLGNHAAELNGLSDLGEMWRQSYEADDLEEQMEMGMNRVSEFYAKLHSYVRHKLSIHYGDNSIDLEKPLPAHLLGDMWGQRWDNIYDLVAPYPHSDAIDVTAALKAKNMTVEDIYDHADKFMSHTGLIMMPEHAWNNSMMTRPADPKVEVMCHPSAWDFCQYVTSTEEKDVRIKICAEVNEESWREVHKQMGHTQYFLQYYAKNYLLRKPANPAFLEAVGDTIELSIMTPSHLQAVGLIENATTDDEADLNFLMKQALAKVASVPFSYMVDRWRWDLFSGRITSDKMERKWWEYRELYQGLNPPVVRSENDFDPGAVYQVSHDIPYAKMFISNLLQFEMHKALCEAAGLYNTTNSSTPLHLCDIYGSKMAGGMLSAFMQHGSALSAQEVLRQLTGSENISVAAMLEYFSPLETYLDSYLSKNQLKHGWNSDIDRWFNSSSTEDDTVPIVVGCVLAGLVVVVLVAYLVGRSRAKRRASAKMAA